MLGGIGRMRLQDSRVACWALESVTVPCHRPHLRVDGVDDNITALTRFARQSPTLSDSHHTEPVPAALFRRKPEIVPVNVALYLFQASGEGTI